jgi:hypothetical protein
MLRAQSVEDFAVLNGRGVKGSINGEHLAFG